MVIFQGTITLVFSVTTYSLENYVNNQTGEKEASQNVSDATENLCTVHQYLL